MDEVHPDGPLSDDEVTKLRRIVEELDISIMMVEARPGRRLRELLIRARDAAAEMLNAASEVRH